MALTIHSYTKSKGIIDTYVVAMVHAKRKCGHISIKELCGFTFDDIDNAMKIVIAHLAKEKDHSDYEKQVNNFSAISSYLQIIFINDDAFQKIDDNAVDKHKNVLLIIENRILWEESENLETIESFSKYCLAVIDDPDYWNIVQNRIGLKQNLSPEQKIVSQPEQKVVNKSGSSKYTIYGLSALFYVAYALALFYYPIRLAIFIIGIVINFVTIIISANDETLNGMIAFYAFNLVLFILGIMFPAISVYILVIVLLSGICFSTYNKYFNKKGGKITTLKN